MKLSLIGSSNNEDAASLLLFKPWRRFSWKQNKLKLLVSPRCSDGAATNPDGSRVTGKLHSPPSPHLQTDSSPRQPSPHLILGCPVVMFFNYVSLFNVATAHPYLVNRCNFSCRAEMQPFHPGIKGQIEPPRAHTHTHAHTDLHLFLYSLGLHLQFKP